MESALGIGPRIYLCSLAVKVTVSGSQVCIRLSCRLDYCLLSLHQKCSGQHCFQLGLVEIVSDAEYSGSCFSAAC